MSTPQSTSTVTLIWEDCWTLLLMDDETTKAKQKELNRLAEFGVYETVEILVPLGKKRVTTLWELDHRKDGLSARFGAREFKSDEMMYDVFAPNSTLRTRRIIEYPRGQKLAKLIIFELKLALS